MRKKSFFVLSLQVVVIGVFVLIAVGSGTDGSAVSSREASSAIRSFAQGYACGSNGFQMVGTASSESGCRTLCANSGYSAYCFGDQGGCFCK